MSSTACQSIIFFLHDVFFPLLISINEPSLSNEIFPERGPYLLHVLVENFLKSKQERVIPCIRYRKFRTNQIKYIRYYNSVRHEQKKPNELNSLGNWIFPRESDCVWKRWVRALLWDWSPPVFKTLWTWVRLSPKNFI